MNVRTALDANNNQPAPTDREVVLATHQHAVAYLFSGHWVTMVREIDARHYTFGAQSEAAAWKAHREKMESDARSKLAQTEEPRIGDSFDCAINDASTNPSWGNGDKVSDWPTVPSPPQTEEPQITQKEIKKFHKDCVYAQSDDGGDRNAPQATRYALQQFLIARPSPPRVDAAPANLGYMAHAGPWSCAECGFTVPYDPDWSVMSKTIGEHTKDKHTAPFTGIAAPAKEIELPMIHLTDADITNGDALFQTIGGGKENRERARELARRLCHNQRYYERVYLATLRDLREAREQIEEHHAWQEEMRREVGNAILSADAVKQINFDLLEQVKERDAALALACELHGCGSEECAATKYREDGKKLIAENETVFNLKAELAALRADREKAVAKLSKNQCSGSVLIWLCAFLIGTFLVWNGVRNRPLHGHVGEFLGAKHSQLHDPLRNFLPISVEDMHGYVEVGHIVPILKVGSIFLANSDWDLADVLFVRGHHFILRNLVGLSRGGRFWHPAVHNHRLHFGNDLPERERKFRWIDDREIAGSFFSVLHFNLPMLNLYPRFLGKFGQSALLFNGFPSSSQQNPLPYHRANLQNPDYRQHPCKQFQLPLYCEIIAALLASLIAAWGGWLWGRRCFMGGGLLAIIGLAMTASVLTTTGFCDPLFWRAEWRALTGQEADRCSCQQHSDDQEFTHHAATSFVVVPFRKIVLPKENSRFSHRISETGFAFDPMPIVILDHHPDEKPVVFAREVPRALEFWIEHIFPLHHDRRNVRTEGKSNFLRRLLLFGQYLHVPMDAFYPGRRTALIAGFQTRQKIGREGFLPICMSGGSIGIAGIELFEIGKYPGSVPINLSFDRRASLNRLPSNRQEGQNDGPCPNALGECDVLGPYWRLIGLLCIVISLCGIVFSDRRPLNLACSVLIAVLGGYCILGHTDDCCENSNQSKENPVFSEESGHSENCITKTLDRTVIVYYI